MSGWRLGIRVTLTLTLNPENLDNIACEGNFGFNSRDDEVPWKNFSKQHNRQLQLNL